MTKKPIAVGFGISKPEQAKQIASWGADGVIVGSALVRALGEAPTPGASDAAKRALRAMLTVLPLAADGLRQLTALITSLRAALPAASR